MKKYLLLPLSFVSAVSFASELNFSAGGGWPYLAMAQLESYENDQRWYVNLGLGLDPGAALGWERIMNDHRTQSLGIVVGALGIRDGKSECDDGVLPCFIDLFDDESVYGLGGTYTYAFSGFDAPGWRINAVVGYGQGHRSNENKTAGSISLSYRF